MVRSFARSAATASALRISALSIVQSGGCDDALEGGGENVARNDAKYLLVTDAKRLETLALL